MAAIAASATPAIPPEIIVPSVPPHLVTPPLELAFATLGLKGPLAQPAAAATMELAALLVIAPMEEAARMASTGQGFAMTLVHAKPASATSMVRLFARSKTTTAILHILQTRTSVIVDLVASVNAVGTVSAPDMAIATATHASP
jgi:hypothetical protein